MIVNQPKTLISSYQRQGYGIQLQTVRRLNGEESTVELLEILIPQSLICLSGKDKVQNDSSSNQTSEQITYGEKQVNKKIMQKYIQDLRRRYIDDCSG